MTFQVGEGQLLIQLLQQFHDSKATAVKSAVKSGISLINHLCFASVVNQPVCDLSINNDP